MSRRGWPRDCAWWVAKDEEGVWNVYPPDDSLLASSFFRTFAEAITYAQHAARQETRP